MNTLTVWECTTDPGPVTRAVTAALLPVWLVVCALSWRREARRGGVPR